MENPLYMEYLFGQFAFKFLPRIKTDSKISFPLELLELLGLIVKVYDLKTKKEMVIDPVLVP
jgi:hypothetical protein